MAYGLCEPRSPTLRELFELINGFFDVFLKVFGGFGALLLRQALNIDENRSVSHLISRQERVEWLRGFHKLPWRDEENVLKGVDT